MSEVKTAPKKRGRPKKVSGLAALDAAAAPAKTTKVVKVKAPVKKAKSPEPKPEPVQQPEPEPEPEPEPVAPVVVEVPEPVVAAPKGAAKKKGKSRKKPAKVEAVAEPPVVKQPNHMTQEGKDAITKHMVSLYDGGLDKKEGKSIRMKLMNRVRSKGMTLEEAIADIA